MESNHTGILICRAEYAVRDQSIITCLYAHHAGVAFEYVLEVRQGPDSISCQIGQDLEAARKVLFRVLSGGVTLCHICDVVGDDLFSDI